MKTSIEQSLLRLFIYFSVGYQLVQLLYDFFFTDYVMITQLENVVTALLYLLILFLGSDSPDGQINPMWVFLVAACSFTFEWFLFGGFDSSMPYDAVLLIMIILICSSGKQRAWSASLFALLLLALLFQHANQWVPVYNPEIYPSTLTLNFDFLLHGLFIVMITFMLKEKFDNYRTRIFSNNKKLKRIDQKIVLKNQDLARQQTEIQQLNANLEKMIEQEVQKIKEKNNKLAEYAFVNAHHLRGPLCRIMGLVELMEVTAPEDVYTTSMIKKRAEELDVIIKEINQIIS